MERARKKAWQPDSAWLKSRSDDWYLHKPSTRQERAETAELNRESLASSQPAYPAPVNELAIREQGYELALREYRAARRRYDRQTREYAQQMQKPYASKYHEKREQHFATPVAHVPPVAPRYIPSLPPYQDERLAPWHGYNPGPGNGY
jgi:hypothetical protein